MNKRSLIFSALIFGLHPKTQQFLSVLRPYYVSRLSQACVNCLTSLAIYFELSRRGPSRDWGGDGGRVFRARSLTEGGYVAWVLRLVEIGAEGEGSCADVVEISRPDGCWCTN